MREALLVVVPLAVAAFIAYRLRDLPLRWCAVPLTLAMGEAVFLRTWDWSLAVPLLPTPVQWGDVVFASLVVSWLIIRESRPSQPAVRFGGDLFSVWLMIAVVLVEIPLAWDADGRLGLGVVLAARDWLYVGLAILIWVDLLRRFSRRGTEIARGPRLGECPSRRYVLSFGGRSACVPVPRLGAAARGFHNHRT